MQGTRAPARVLSFDAGLPDRATSMREKGHECCDASSPRVPPASCRWGTRLGAGRAGRAAVGAASRLDLLGRVLATTRKLAVRARRGLRVPPDLLDLLRSFGPERFAYLPFGGGPRICVGASFAMQEAAIVLATLLARFDFVPDHGPQPRMILTRHPEGGVRLRATPR